MVKQAFAAILPPKGWKGFIFATKIYLSARYHIALVGNPNSGKTSLFNCLTGMNQKVGNFAGVTVDKKIGLCTLPNKLPVNIIDLPGTYSLYPKSGDEFVAYDALLHAQAEEKPDLLVVLADASNLKRNLLFCSQIIDLGLPVIVALSMVDIAAKKGISINNHQLAIQLGVPIVQINPRKDKGLLELKKQIQQSLQSKNNFVYRPSIDATNLHPQLLQKMQLLLPNQTPYACLHIATNLEAVHFISADVKQKIEDLLISFPLQKTKIQTAEIIQRYQFIGKAMKHSVVEEDPLQKELQTEKLDKILLHPLWGNIILLLVLFLLFQSVYWLASYPMDWIDTIFSNATGWLANILPNHLLSNLLTNGILAGLGGILVFIPQIMILFALITLLEDTGYMARIVFLTDRLMRSVGLNGKAVVPLISGLACAVPAIMSARTIENKKEKLITILITPLMSCSARLPVYTILIALVIPEKKYLGFISLQGIVMMCFYLLGFVMALLVAKILNFIIKNKHKSIFLMELPVYRAPRWKNIGITIWQKALIFVKDAGKVILIISIAIWALCNFGPTGKRTQVEEFFAKKQIESPSQNFTAEKNSQLLEFSYAGYLGKAIEPAIKPLGFDWKIGIALLTSFAAREVFVGTMATIYSVGNEEDTNKTIMEKMSNATNEKGEKVYTLATGISLLLFYVFAMQCMSTMAIVKRETGTWFYPIVQFLYMGIIAYLFSFVAFNIFR